jgi:hypothetical protein
MTVIDHQKEQQRLAALYASLSETDSHSWLRIKKSLTEDALRVLESECSRRGLQFERQNLALMANQEDVSS